LAGEHRGMTRTWHNGTGRKVAFAAALGVAVSLAAPGAARAQGFFDFLFGGPQQPPPPPASPNAAPSAGIGRISPVPLGESVHEGGESTGHSVAFCVRLCDGQHFPLERLANATPAETCHAICPSSATKVYVGAEIAAAVSSDGTHYSELNTAFLYRKRLVANCTCNGKDPFGLATLDVNNDPTLRPGDIVSTKDGFVAFSGKAGQATPFTPVNPAAVTGSARPQPAQPASDQPEIDDEPGTVVQPGVNLHRPVGR
jgi:Protein of unknown function (DUF2865)